MTSTFKKFMLLLWKDWLIQIRHWVKTLVQLLIPILGGMLIIYLRNLILPSSTSTPTKYFALPLEDLAFISKIPINPDFEYTATLAYSPKNPVLQELVETVLDKLQLLDTVPVIALEDDVELERFLVLNATFAGIEFENSLKDVTLLPKNLKYALRFPSEIRTNFSSSWKTDYLFPRYPTNSLTNPTDIDGGNPAGYYREGFIILQNVLFQTFFNKVSTSTTTLPNIYLERFPYPAYDVDEFPKILEGILPLILILSLLYIFNDNVKYIVVEKEGQLKESMKIMGLTNSLHWMAWFTKSIIIFLIAISIMTILYCCVATEKVNVHILEKSNWLLIWLLLFIYSIATIMFSFLISVFFSRSSTAASIAAFVFIVTYSLYIIFRRSYDTLGLTSKIVLSLFSNTAMCFGFLITLRHEAAGNGLQWHNLFTPVNINDNFAVGHIMIILLVDAFIYLILTLYVEKVFPGRYGIGEKWNFFMMKNFWKNKIYNSEIMEDIPANKLKNVEAPPANLVAGVKIRGLTKEYSNKKLAVKDLYLDMYMDQITVLLGHNGAGKTTTMSMLTGLLGPTSGTALINGEDIRTNMDGVRNSLGICPQHNVLFDELTVMEHLIFFGRLKGVPDNVIEADANRILSLLGLDDKLKAQSRTLSGGMKRRLSVAIALIGDSKVIFLDEPTSGMDPASRRFLWDLLATEKKNRTILLSTHFMDEADVLGDRIAIMAHGELKACGSSFYLKKKFGIGYRLVCVKETSCKTDEVTQLLQKFIPTIKIETNIGSELSYILSNDYISEFKTLLAALEDNSSALGISSYGISLTTLEEVFHKVGKLAPLATAEVEMDNLIRINATKLLPPGCTLYKNQIKAMLLKKYYSIKRNLFTLFFIIFIPVFFILIAMITEILSKDIIVMAPRLITTDSYPHMNILLEDSYNDSGIYNNYIKLGSRPNIEMEIVPRKMENYILEKSAKNLPKFNKNYFVAASFLKSKFIAWFNNKAYHSAPLSLSLIHNAILKAHCGSSCGITVTNKPLPLRPQTRLSKIDNFGTLGYMIAENIAISLAFIGGAFIFFYIRERTTRAKLLQFVSGVNILIFWGVSFVWDYVLLLFIALLSVGTLALFHKDNFATFDELGIVYLIYVLTGWSFLPIMYLLTLVFNHPASGFVKFSIMFLFLGLVAFVILTVMSFDPDLVDLTKTLVSIFLISPLFALSDAILKFERVTAIKKICANNVYLQDLPQCKDLNVFDWEDGITRHLIYMFFVGLFCIAFLLLWEYRYVHLIMTSTIKLIRKLIRRRNSPRLEFENVGSYDADVEHEKNLILGMSAADLETIPLVIKNLSKTYKGGNKAVKELSLQVGSSECFGLLGVNGAGKTTTFKMLTGDININSGDAWVRGISKRTHMTDVYKHIGYCPQFDALLIELTGRETIEMFSLLRGVHPVMIPYLTEKLAHDLDIVKYLDTSVGAYSGGNKRKLSTIVALLGDPSVIYLDEPTTGMDPGARRQFWDVIIKLRNSGLSIVLTSHSMEECEALCTRLAIMASGEFKCLGSTQHLKSRFLFGYVLNIKIKRDLTSDSEVKLTAIEAKNEIKDFIAKTFKESILKEEYFDSISYNIPKSGLKWSEIFGIMEHAREVYQIEDYSLAQAALEQVFLHFSQYSENEGRILSV